MGMRLVSWNVNGFRAVVKKGFWDWFDEVDADVVCLQETKAQIDQVEDALRLKEGYEAHWFSAQKKGYSGVAIYTREEPEEIIHGLGKAKFDDEGRVITAVFPDFHMINAYFPNSQKGPERLEYKLEFWDAMLAYCNKIRKSGRHVVLCGDYNIAHEEIDLHDPKNNHDTAGFLPEERAWMTKFLQAGYVDVFREEVSTGDQYTYWSYRAGARPRNAGWRIDYHCVDEGLMDQVMDVGHQADVMGSDHCPVYLDLDV